jgi:putative addiction module killer protein
MDRSPPPLRILCWTSRSGAKPVREWLSSMDDQSFRKIDRLLGLLRQMGARLGPPHVKHLGQALFELRDTSRGPGMRLYFSWQDPKTIVLLGAGTKDHQRLDLKVARRRLLEIEED